MQDSQVGTSSLEPLPKATHRGSPLSGDRYNISISQLDMSQCARHASASAHPNYTSASLHTSRSNTFRHNYPSQLAQLIVRRIAGEEVVTRKDILNELSPVG